MATLTQHSQKAITDIIKEMTRPISDILGEPPMTPLENRSRKRSLPIPLRSHDSTSEADIMAITRSYIGPDSFLQGGRVSGELPPPRKRPRIEKKITEAVTKKRRREEKPPRPENGTKKRDRDTSKKPRTEEAKVRPPSGIKLTSQPVPRETNGEITKKSRLSNGASLRKKEDTLEQSKKESKKHVKKEFDDVPKKEQKKESKETSRQRPPPVLRIPASVIPRSEPRPLKSSSLEESGSDADRRKAKAKKKESEPKRLLISRVPASETVERRRPDEAAKTTSVESPERSASSSERRRPRSRQLNDDSVRQRDREYTSDREPSRRDKPRKLERERERESDRERSDRERDSLRRSSVRADRENDVDKARERIRSSRERDIKHGRDSERDRERDRRRESSKRDDHIDRVNSNRAKDRARDNNPDRERPSLRRSLPPSRPDSGRESTSAGQSPGDGRGVPLTSKPANRSGSSHSTVGEVTPRKSTRVRHGRAELQKNLARQKQLEKEFKSTLAKCEQQYKSKDYDAFEETAKQGFRLSFDLGLAMETELRLDAIRSMNPDERSARKRGVIDHYKALTKSYATKRMAELDSIGRKEGCAFYKRGVQKVYFRMFCCHNLLDKDVQTSNRHLQLYLADIINGRKAGKSNKLAEEEFSTRKLNNIKRLVDEHVNILSIFESITADHGGFEEAGAEGYVP